MTDKKKIILRRGTGVDLPGKPRAISPKQWHRALDEGEMAFSADDGRIFVGPNSASELPQARRLQYPYQNIEVVGENSSEVFARLHGGRIHEGDNRDYYFAVLPPVADDSASAPVGFIPAIIIVGINALGIVSGAIRTASITNSIVLMAGIESDSERDDSSPYRYWRIKKGNRENIYYPQQILNEVEFHETVGGADISQDATILTPNGIGLPSPFQLDHVVSNAFDGNLPTRWHGFDPRSNPNNPLCGTGEGLILDFGSPRVVREVAFYKENSLQDFGIPDGDGYATWYAYNQIEQHNLLQVSNDRYNWGAVYEDKLYGLGSRQWRHIPERPIPMSTTRGCGIKLWSTTGNTTARGITGIQFYDQDNIAINDFTVSYNILGSGTHAHVVFDGNDSTEYLSNSVGAGPPATDEYTNATAVYQTGITGIGVSFWVWFDTPKQVSRFTITGPSDASKAPINFTFYALKTVIDSQLRIGYPQVYPPINFSNQTNWTSKEVRSFPVSLP